MPRGFWALDTNFSKSMAVRPSTPLALGRRELLTGVFSLSALGALTNCAVSRPPSVPRGIRAPPDRGGSLPDAARALRALIERYVGVRQFGRDTSGATQFLTFPSPGLPVPAAELDFNIPSRAAAAAVGEWSRLVDLIPDLSAQWTTDGRTVSSIYRQTLTQAKVASGRVGKRDRRVDPAHVLRAQLKPRYERYWVCFQNAQREYNVEQAKALAATDELARARWRQLRPRLIARRMAAFENWEAHGGRSAYESAEASIAQLRGGVPLLAWSAWKDRVESAVRTDAFGSYLLSNVFPAPLVGATADPYWTSFALTTSDIQALCGPEDQCTPPENASTSEGRGKQVTTPVLHLSAQILHAPITRSWMDPLLFRCRFWDWPDQRLPLSDGAVTPSGTLTAYVSSVLLARNLDVSFAHAPRLPAESSLGPFSLCGASFENCQSISVPGVQILAFVCQRVPRAPNPDPSLDWN